MASQQPEQDAAFVDAFSDHPQHVSISEKLYGERTNAIVEQLRKIMENTPNLGVYSKGSTLEVKGTILIEYHEQKGHIPVNICLTSTFPKKAPIVRIPRTSETILNSDLFDKNNCLILNYLIHWDQNHSNLQKLIHAMKRKFSRSPPLLRIDKTEEKTSQIKDQSFTSSGYDRQSFRAHSEPKTALLSSEEPQASRKHDTQRPTDANTTNVTSAAASSSIDASTGTDARSNNIGEFSKTEIQCSICKMRIPELFGFSAGCGHSICCTCFQGYLKTQVTDESNYPIKCFNSSCDRQYSEQTIEDVLASIGDEGASLIKQFRFSSITHVQDNSITKCPYSNCNGIFIIEKDTINTTTTTAKARWQFKDNGYWFDMDNGTMEFLETSYSERRDNVQINISGRPYQFDLVNMRQINLLTEGTRNIKRVLANNQKCRRSKCPLCIQDVCMKCGKIWETCNTQRTAQESEEKSTASITHTGTPEGTRRSPSPHNRFTTQQSTDTSAPSSVSCHQTGSGITGAASNEVFCAICRELTAEMYSFSADCNHVTCCNCFQRYLQSKINDLSMYPIACYEPSCGQKYSDHCIEDALASVDDRGASLINMYRLFLVKASQGDMISKCPYSNCDADFFIEPEFRNCKRSTCPECARDICMKCGHSWETCNNELVRGRRSIVRPTPLRREIRSISPSERIFHDSGSERFAKCPKCNIKIERSGGCNHMTHNKCRMSRTGRTEFCIWCGTELFQRRGRLVESNGTTHYPAFKGRYSRCRLANVSSISNSQSFFGSLFGDD